MEQFKRNILQGIMTWQFLLSAVIIFTLCVHTFTLADILKSSPSEGFSRELKIADVDYGYSKFNRYHMISVLSYDKKNIGIFSVDGTKSHFYMVDTKGNILSEQTILLDLSSVSMINGYFINESQLEITYGTNTLEGAVIDINTGQYKKVEYKDLINSFDSVESQIIYLTSDGLYGFNSNQQDSDETLLIKGDISSFKIIKSDNNMYLIAMEKLDSSHTDIHLIQTNENFEDLNDRVLYQDTSSLLGNLKDIYINDGIISSLFVRADRKGNVNHITVIQTDENTGEELSRITNIFNLYTGRISIVKALKGSVNLIMQDEVINGVNIVEDTLTEGENDVIIEPLTKTRGVSALPSYFKFNGNRVLIFSDISKSYREIYIASSDPELVHTTTSYKSVNMLQTVGTTLLIFVVAAFISIIFILIIDILPLLIMTVFSRFINKSKHKYYILMSAGAIIHTIIKIFAANKAIISNSAYYSISANIFGKEPYIYIVLVLSSAYSLLCTFRFAKQKGESDLTTNFGFFVIVDIALLAFTVTAYALTSMLIYNL